MIFKKETRAISKVIFACRVIQGFKEALLLCWCHVEVCIWHKSFRQHACCDLFFGACGFGSVCKTAVAGVCMYVCMYVVREERRGEEEKKEVREEKQVESSSTWFPTDGYCLEFQGHDLTLCSLSISQTL